MAAQACRQLSRVTLAWLWLLISSARPLMDICDSNCGWGGYIVNSWRARVQKSLMELPRRTVLICDRMSGIELVSELLGTPNLPALPVWIEKSCDVRDFVERILAIANERLGVSLATSATPLQEVMSLLRDYQKHVGPIYLILGWAEDCIQYASELLDAIIDGSSVLVVTTGGEQVSLRALHELMGYSIIDGAFLRMTQLEASIEMNGILPESTARRLRKQVSGNFVSYQLAALAYLDDSKGESHLQGRSWDSNLPPAVIIDGLIHRGLWSAAFDFVCRFAVDELPTILDKAGDRFFNMGEHGYLFRRLSLLPEAIRYDPSVAFWYFAAASAIGKQWLLFPSIRTILSREEAPNLRAVVAMSRPGLNTLEETARAMAMSENPVTMRAHGFALGLAGEYDTPIMLFNDAIKMANANGNDHLAIAAGLDIAQLQVRRGRFSDAIGWATWALTDLERRDVRDRMRRISALATLAYVELLVGDVNTAKQYISDVHLNSDEARVPGMEAALTTLGDIYVVEGDYESAERMYRTHYDRAPIDVSATASLDFVVLELARGRLNVAEKYADYAMALSTTSSSYEQAIGRLARGMVQVDRDGVKAEALLREAIERLRGLDVAVPMMQAIIWLAIALMRQGDAVAASRVLLQEAALLDQLSSSGWLLLGARHKRLGEVQTLFRQSRSSAQIKFLKTSYIRLDNERIDLPVKQAEIIALLALYPDGLSAERLDDLQFGRGGDSNRTKVAVSRLRKEIPISTAPYRLTVPFKADFIEASKLLDAGQWQKALNLYTGPLLPLSESPTIVEHRAFLEESFRQTALSAKDSDALIQLGTVLDDDLEIWLAAKAHLPPGDYRGPAIAARIRRIKAGW